MHQILHVGAPHETVGEPASRAVWHTAAQVSIRSSFEPGLRLVVAQTNERVLPIEAVIWATARRNGRFASRSSAVERAGTPAGRVFFDADAVLDECHSTEPCRAVAVGQPFGRNR
jgi:hypothetical protein